jgi:DNA-directed RNA polymerase subunit H (RpoH/RPB5)
MEAETKYILIQSRKTVLDILEERGYDPLPYRNISNDQLITLAGAGEKEQGKQRALDVFLNKREGSNATCDRAVVVYQLIDKLRLRIATFMKELYSDNPESSSPEGNEVYKKDELIIILNEPYHEVFDKAALQAWQTDKARVSFFHIKQLVVHPGRHILVPPHRKLTAEEAKEEMERYYITQKSQLPLIKHHDIQARVLGLVPGDLIEVLRPSPTAGVARFLRICAA